MFCNHWLKWKIFRVTKMGATIKAFCYPLNTSWNYLTCNKFVRENLAHNIYKSIFICWVILFSKAFLFKKKRKKEIVLLRRLRSSACLFDSHQTLYSFIHRLCISPNIVFIWMFITCLILFNITKACTVFIKILSILNDLNWIKILFN